MTYWIFLLVLGAAVVLLISPIRIWVDYRYRGKVEDALTVQVTYLWGLRAASIQMPVISSSGRRAQSGAKPRKGKKHLELSLSSLGQIRERLNNVKGLYGVGLRVYRFFSSSITVKRLTWHTEIGVWDSARLAQLCGALWGIKGMVGACVQRLFRTDKQLMFKVLPNFHRSHFRTVFTCILEFPLGYAIIASIFAQYLILKYKFTKRGVVNARTSDSRVNEDSHGEHQGDGGCQYSNR